MPKLPDTIKYHNPDTDQDYYVHRLHRPNINLFGARKVLELVTDSYADEFEQPEPGKAWSRVKPGAMKARFMGSQKANLRQMLHMNKSIAAGSTYWHVNPSDSSITDRIFGENARLDIGALAMTSPSRATRAQRLYRVRPNCYLNDLIVAPDLQHDPESARNHRLGTMLLHAALRHGSFRPSAALALDAFAGNSAANAWFERLGMEPVETELPGFDVHNGTKLAQIRYSSMAGMSLRDHVEQLETTADWLADAVVVEQA